MSFRDTIRGAVEKLGKSVVERQHAAGRQALVQAFADPDRAKRAATGEGLKAQLAPLEARLTPERWATLVAAIDGAVDSGTSDELLREVDAAEADLKPRA